MPTWTEILHELVAQSNSGDPDALGTVRRKYLAALSSHTGRNVIAYYSGFLDRPAGSRNLNVDDNDMNFFMRVIQGLDRTKGLDLILHTQGGDIAATEAIVGYLRKMFGNDYRVIVPQMAMSAGAMISCSAESIVMGKHSSLGPIDPQMGGMPTQSVIKEFRRAIEEMNAEPNSPGTFAAWQLILSKYPPTLINSCEQAVEWAEKIVTDWLESNMFANDDNPSEKAALVVQELSNHSEMKTHNRHVPVEKCRHIGLHIINMEDNQTFQELVLSVHHSYMHTFGNTNFAKIVESQEGQASIISA